ncbi:MAG TPA: MBL fold metallo-hydrolase [Nocardioidaceae bacterium]|nr:MBL fold metallo-hydrolase [Nocardioidaceae bacterium]
MEQGSEDWTAPGAFPVADGVHRIPLPLPSDGLRAVNVYALETDDGLTLVDGGWAITEARERLERSLALIDHKVTDINRFLVTHMHRDHYTQAVALRRETGAHVTLGGGERATLELLAERPEGAAADNAQASRLRRAGAPELAERWERAVSEHPPPTGDYELPDSWLEGDVALTVGERTLDAVATPGHTRGHYVFADAAAGLLFAGDHVLPSITPSIGFEPAVAALPLRDFLSSLAKVRALPDLTLLPAHGAVAGSTHARIDELVAHHDVRLDLCEAAVLAGAGTAYEVAARLPWTRRDRALGELDVFNAMLATLETMAHLDLLVATGRLVGDGPDGTDATDGGLLRYAPPAS